MGKASISYPQVLPSAVKSQMLKRKKPSIYLAGPIYGNLEWRKDFIEKLEAESISDFDVYTPQGKAGTVEEYAKYGNITYDISDQTDWETFCMYIADVIVFCVPPMNYYIDDYARETRFELGEWINKIDYSNGIDGDDKQIYIWMSHKLSGKNYIINRIKSNPSDYVHLFDDRSDMIVELAKYINSKAAK